jgi:transitional endoplasmic reticulum ATPase
LTDNEKITAKLKVAEADQRDVGKGIVRVDDSFREKLGLKPFDVIEIKGGKSTSVRIPATRALILSAWMGLSVLMQKLA